MNKKSVFGGLKHPLLLIVVGALFSSLISTYIIPDITRAWQDHQKELELKTDLVSKISEAVATTVVKGEISKGIPHPPHKEDKALNDPLTNWKSSSAVIGSKLQAYFPDSELPQQWNNYSIILADLLFLSASNDTCHRIKYVQEIQQYYSASNPPVNTTEMCGDNLERFQKIYNSQLVSNESNINWTQLVYDENKVKFSTNWLRLKQNLLDQKDRLIQEVLNSHIQLFS